MYEITKRNFKFEAAHRLIQLPDGHPCRNLHGHSWKVEVSLEGDINKNTGFVLDFGELKEIDTYLKNNFDHAVLISSKDTELLEICNKIKTKYFYFKDVEYLSAETLSKYICVNLILPIITANKNILMASVSVWETENNKATYSI